MSPFSSLSESPAAAPEDKASAKSSGAKQDYEERKREMAKRRSEEKKIQRAKEQIPQLEGRLAELDEELFGDAASDYVRAAEIEAEKQKIEEELLLLYELVM